MKSNAGRQFRQYQGAIFSAVILVFCTLALFLGIIPAVQRIQEMFLALQTANDENAVLDQKLSVLNSLDEFVLREKLNQILSAVPSERSFPSLFETIEGVARETNVSIADMSISSGTTLATPSASKATATEKKIGTRTVPFSVTVEGELSALQAFISRTPEVRRLLRIKVFSMSFSDDVARTSISVDMDGFYEPLPTNLGSAKATLPTISDADEELIGKISALPLMTQEHAELPPPVVGKQKTNPFAP